MKEFKPIKQTIIISTAFVVYVLLSTFYHHIDKYLTGIIFILLTLLIPTNLLKSSNFITNWFFGVSGANEKQLLKQILIDTDPIFLSWAIDKIVKWSNNTSSRNIFHIHGTNDRILPMNFINPNIAIKNGGHLMILNNSEKLNEILKQQLTE